MYKRQDKILNLRYEQVIAKRILDSKAHYPKEYMKKASHVCWSEKIDVYKRQALKQVPAAEYNPLEAIKTNIDGARNIVDVAIDKHVEKVVASFRHRKHLRR